METCLLQTNTGSFLGCVENGCEVFRGIPYARAGRFEYASVIRSYDKEVDARFPGPACMQKRAWPEFEHLEIPERKFYHREFREGIQFTYDEEKGLNLNVFTPEKGDRLPVIVFFHGGGFDSGSINSSPFDGSRLASRGCVVVFAQYRVGVFGYFTHEDVYASEGRDGNFGLDDMMQSLVWVQTHISGFRGDNSNVTVMGQSAGAMSIQYLLCSPRAKDLFHKAIMMSGAGRFPKFSLPKPCEQTRSYWKEVMDLCGCKTLDEIRKIGPKELLQAVETQKTRRKDNTYNTMPVVDHFLLPEGIDRLIRHPKEVPLIIGFTNNDMYTVLLAHVSKKYAKAHGGYLYYFDIDAKGDNSQAFHSADLRYAFGTLASSWRPYAESDERASGLMMDYFARFAETGDPNHDGAPVWDICRGRAMRFSDEGACMARPKIGKLLRNTFKKGDPS